MATLVQRPKSLRCAVHSDKLTDTCIVTLSPHRLNYFGLVLIVFICVLTVGFFMRMSGRWDVEDWILICWVVLAAGSLLCGLLFQLVERRLRVCAGEISIEKGIFGVRRHFQIRNGAFELQRFHGCEDMTDEPYAFQLDVIGPASKLVTVVRVYQDDRKFVHNLVEFLCDTTGWNNSEKDVYCPQSSGGESGP